jgi:hypothetical protein
MVRLANQEALPQAILASGFQDDPLSSLIEQREIANQKLESFQNEGNPNDSRIAVFTDEIADLDKKIEERSQSIRVGIDLRASSLKKLL